MSSFANIWNILQNCPWTTAVVIDSVTLVYPTKQFLLFELWFYRISWGVHPLKVTEQSSSQMFFVLSAQELFQFSIFGSQGFYAWRNVCFFPNWNFPGAFFAGNKFNYDLTPDTCVPYFLSSCLFQTLSQPTTSCQSRLHPTRQVLLRYFNGWTQENMKHWTAQCKVHMDVQG